MEKSKREAARISHVCLFFRNRRQVHREEYAGLGQLAHPDHGSGWPVIAHHFNIGSIHLVKTLHFLEKYVDMYDMIQI
jgi:hypothetical protein